MTDSNPEHEDKLTTNDLDKMIELLNQTHKASLAFKGKLSDSFQNQLMLNQIVIMLALEAVLLNIKNCKEDLGY